MRLLMICSLLAICSTSHAEDSFVEDFGASRADVWRLDAGGTGEASISDGRLTLDLSEAKRGKWAYAELNRGITLPARIEWDQCLDHDSQYTWFGGALVWSASFRRTENVQAGLGGGGMKRCAFLGSERGREEAVEAGQWYHLVLEAETTRQTLTVTRRGETEAIVSLESHAGLAHGPFFLTFFQNDHRLGPAFEDAYDQDRGTTWIDNLRITAEKIEQRKPPQPGTTYPYKIPVVFNRATRWLTRADGLTRGCIAYEAAGWMPLTGGEGVSRWLRLERWVIRDATAWPPQPHIEHVADDATVFRLPPGEKEAVFALRALQWNIEQHPVLEWAAEPRGVSWRLELLATDGVRPPTWKLWRSAELSEAGEGRVNVLDAYRKSGRPHRYAEIDFRVHVSAEGEEAADGARELRLRMGMPGVACIVPRSPVVVRAAEARGKGVVIEAAVIGADGEPLLADEAEVKAEVGDNHVNLKPAGDHGVRRGVLRGLSPGEHEVRLTATAPGGTEIIAVGAASITITKLDFADHYERAKRSYCTPKGKAFGPLLGDLIAWIPYRDVDTPNRRLVLGIEEFRALEAAGQSVGYTKWRVLPKADIDRFVEYLADSGVMVIRVTPNVSVAEYYLDAGGHLAMHGFEQLSYILAAARRHGIRAVINLFHYPYLFAGTGNNPPVAQYFEAGYRRDFDWTSDEMWRYLSEYLDELIGHLGTDPAVLAYTVMGENDQRLPPEWINRAYSLIKRQAPHQMVVLEQGGSIFNCNDRDPASYTDFEPAADGGVGFRTYNTYQYPNDCYIAVAGRFYNLGRPSYLGEASCGINTQPQFVTKLRDVMGIALTLQQPMAISWSAALLEGERRPFTEAAKVVDWSAFRRARPPVAIVVDKPDEEQVERMVGYEEALSALPVDYEYIRPAAGRKGYVHVFDAREEYEKPKLDGNLPEAVARAMPLRMSPGNHCTYALSAERRWLIAYIRNATRYEVLPCDVGRIVERCRTADEERPLWVELRGFRGACRYRIWDAGTAELMREGRVEDAARLRFGSTAADIVVLVRPEAAEGGVQREGALGAAADLRQTFRGAALSAAAVCVLEPMLKPLHCHAERGEASRVGPV